MNTTLNEMPLDQVADELTAEVQRETAHPRQVQAFRRIIGQREVPYELIRFWVEIETGHVVPTAGQVQEASRIAQTFPYKSAQDSGLSTLLAQYREEAKLDANVRDETRERIAAEQAAHVGHAD